MPSEGFRQNFIAKNGTASNISIPLPQNAYVKGVYIIRRGDGDIPPIFVIGYIQDTPFGAAANNFNMELIKGFVTDQTDSAMKDWDSGIAWQGDFPTPANYPTYLIIEATNETGTDQPIDISIVYDLVPGGGGWQNKGIQYSWPWGATWAYSAVYTQSNAGGGNVIITVTPGAGSELMIDYIRTGLDNYGADRAVYFDIYDGEATPERQVNLLTLGTVDNEYLVWPYLGATDDLTTLRPRQMQMISGTDNLRLTFDSLANTETVTLSIRARIRGVMPTVAHALSTGTVGAPTVVYNTVI